MTKPLENLIAEVDQIARTACCAWEAHAARNRGVDGPGLSAGLARRDWALASEVLQHPEFQIAERALSRIARLERGEKQAPHSRRAIALIREYQRSQEP